MEWKVNIEEVLSSKKPKVGQTLFIAVDGHGGSGKSALAVWLAEKLKAQIVRTIIQQQKESLYVPDLRPERIGVQD